MKKEQSDHHDYREQDEDEDAEKRTGQGTPHPCPTSTFFILSFLLVVLISIPLVS